MQVIVVNFFKITPVWTITRNFSLHKVNAKDNENIKDNVNVKDNGCKSGVYILIT